MKTPQTSSSNITVPLITQLFKMEEIIWERKTDHPRNHSFLLHLCDSKKWVSDPRDMMPFKALWPESVDDNIKALLHRCWPLEVRGAVRCLLPVTRIWTVPLWAGFTPDLTGRRRKWAGVQLPHGRLTNKRNRFSGAFVTMATAAALGSVCLLTASHP